MYEHYLSPHREDIESVLEIGILEGRSLRAWRDYFPNAEVYGMDINPQSLFTEDRIQCTLGDQGDQHSLVSVARKYGPFDFICDDGSHVFHHQLVSLLTLWEYVNFGGFYIIEDIQDGTYFETLRMLGAETAETGGHYDDRLAIFKKVT
jgi:demethylmacrocin O-methyltransferase